MTGGASVASATRLHPCRSSRVVLKGHLSFDAPPTVAEQPSRLFRASALGMVLVSKAVAISGALDGEGKMTTVVGGTNPFYVEAPGAPVAIRGLHFIHSRAVAIRVVAAGHLEISGNRIEGVATDSDAAIGIAISTSPRAPAAGAGKPGLR